LALPTTGCKRRTMAAAVRLPWRCFGLEAAFGADLRGQGNSFGHPHPLVLARYRQQGLRIYDSAQHGAIHLRLGGFRGAVADASTTAFLALKHH
jgi:hypothetical protein